MLDVRSNFGAVPLGPFVRKDLAWPGQTIIADADPNGNFFSIVADSRFGGQCCRLKFGAGKFGEGSQFYKIALGNPGVAVVVEFDLLIEAGFDMSGGPGKFGPMLVWGGRSGPAGGAIAMIDWSAQVTPNPKPFNTILQNQQSPTSFPSQLISPPVYTANIQTERVYHWYMEFLGGPGGHAKFELDGTPVPATVVSMGNTSVGDPVVLEVGFFSGGQNAPAHDSFARHGNIYVYTKDVAVIKSFSYNLN